MSSHIPSIFIEGVSPEYPNKYQKQIASNSILPLDEKIFDNSDDTASFFFTPLKI
jgi:hypothetical protein